MSQRRGFTLTMLDIAYNNKKSFIIKTNKLNITFMSSISSFIMNIYFHSPQFILCFLLYYQ